MTEGHSTCYWTDLINVLKAGTKWLPFCRRYFQNQCFNGNCSILIKFQLILCLSVQHHFILWELFHFYLNFAHCSQVFNYHIWAKKKWLPFSRQHFHIHFWKENVWISIKISLKFVPKGLIKNIAALVQIMARRLPGDKLLSEPMMLNLPMHTCVTWLQCVNKPALVQIMAYELKLSLNKTVQQE